MFGWARAGCVGVCATVLVLTAAACNEQVGPTSAAVAPQRDPPSPDDANTLTVDDGQLQRLKVMSVENRAFQIEKSAPGRIAFNEDRSTPVFPPFQGRVVRFFARPGDVVAPGSPLLEIDSPDLVQANADLIAASVAVRKAQNQLTQAQRVATRQRDLYDVGAGAYKDFEQAGSDLRNAENDLKTAQGQLTAARNHMRTPFGIGDTAIAKIETTHEVDRLSQLVAPIAGTVTARKVGPGQYVKPDNPDPLFTIADVSTMWLLANVYETDIASVQVGQPVEVHVMAYPERTFRARITYVAAAVDPATHRIAVRAEVLNPDGKLKPEMFASFRILTSEAVQRRAVPTTAIIREGDTPRLWVARARNTFVRRDVTLGEEQQGWTEVTSGLRAGERVVVAGGLFLSNSGEPGSASSGTKSK
jgi:membrane fusion protein, heavy metal efflux system